MILRDLNQCALKRVLEYIPGVRFRGRIPSMRMLLRQHRRKNRSEIKAKRVRQEEISPSEIKAKRVRQEENSPSDNYKEVDKYKERNTKNVRRFEL